MTDIRPHHDPDGMSGRADATASTAKDEATSVADTARAQASDVAATTTEQARAVASDARFEARRVVQDSRRQLMDQANEQTNRLAGSVRGVSSQLQTVVRGGQPPQGLVGDLASQAADASARLADHLESRGPEQLLDDVRRFARRRPGTFLLGALGAGMLAGRLVRAVDTSQLVDAAKAGAGVDDGHDAPSSMIDSSASGDDLRQLAAAVRP